ncbi:MAG: DUF512 domain-containing protein [Eubacteriales bacterium]|nr:DUF512 domain-containing protein [Eubacteriales bacterium]
MPKSIGQLISGCLPGSIAEELGIRAGDHLLLIDGQKVRDVFDFRLRQLAENLILTVEQADGTPIEYDIEKDEDEDLGLEFVDELLDDCTACHNKCVFCFIDQLPKGLRKTLYFKDDDLRLTFLNGNYVTLTNISDDELDRLIAYKFSPMNISVHTTDPALRLKMMKNKNSGQIMARLQRIASAGIALNTQIVLCPGWNDQAALERTIADLSTLHPAVQSIAVVPVGVTRYRDENGLEKMRTFTEDECRDVILSVERWQNHFKATRGTYVYHAADEFYLRGHVAFPSPETYDDFPQLENGVGMVSLFLSTITTYLQGELAIEAMEPFDSAVPPLLPTSGTRVLIPTGTLVGPIVAAATAKLASRLGLEIVVCPIINAFLGDTITVTGLLTGQDVQKHLQTIVLPGDVVLMPASMFKADSPVFLDDMTQNDLAIALNVPVHAVKADAQGLISGLLWLIAQRSTTP